MNAVLHRFPFPNPGTNWSPDTPISMEAETFEPARAAELNDAVQNLIRQSEVILDLLQSDRDLVRRIGIESLCVEIIAILEGDKFDRVASAVEESAQKNKPLTLTRDGLSRIRRLEVLVAEADRNIGRFVPVRQSRGSNLGSLGQASSPGQMDGFFMGAMVVLGALAVTILGAVAVTYIISTTKADRR